MIPDLPLHPADTHTSGPIYSGPALAKFVEDLQKRKGQIFPHYENAIKELRKRNSDRYETANWTLNDTHYVAGFCAFIAWPTLLPISRTQ